MQVVILAGGLGTRLSEETHEKPKPMVEIGGRPILWHIMKYYSHFGFNDFVICLGYKGYIIKEYFMNYKLHTSDLSLNLSSGSFEIFNNCAEPWKIKLIDTGVETMTGGRLLRIKDYLQQDDCFLMTYGDGLANIQLDAEIAFHHNHGRLATVASVVPPGRFGALVCDGDIVTEFNEKFDVVQSRINGGFFVLSTKVLDLITDDKTIWEQGPLQKLAENRQLKAFHHDGFWQPMDTLREKKLLNELWDNGKAPWRCWRD